MGKSEGFRVDRAVSQGCIMSPWFFNVYVAALMKGMERSEISGGGERAEITWLLVW